MANHTPQHPTTSEERPMIQVLVSCNSVDLYPAMVDPTDQVDGFVRPWFDLGTVQRIAEDTQANAERYGHGSYDTIHVLTGQVDRQTHAVVASICWMYLGTEHHQTAAEILQPDAAGRYAVGGHGWGWHVLADDLTPLIPFTPNPS
ncbi:hypothetical protein ACFY0G_32455 [Streptomyces sp. NPDC001552]|uniref:hypothetical protein n=1 Tax=Streptomyces sp. NPDC001552 TaxID=3364587 RepID=UPI00367D7104